MGCDMKMNCNLNAKW